MQITYRELTLKFIEFLKEHNALEDFKKEFIRQHKKSLTWYEYINPLINENINKYAIHNNRECAANIISAAFSWCGSKKGLEFWYTLHKLWFFETIKQNYTLTSEKYDINTNCRNKKTNNKYLP